MQSLGINIGSSSIKVVLLEDERVRWETVVAHEGNFIETLKNILLERQVPAGVPSLVTGTEGRFLLNMNNVLESICVEEALKRLELKVDASVSLGGENFVVYTIDENGKIITSFSGNKCASGTGEFFKQQLGRMDLRLADVANVPDTAVVCHMSSRCSVFMKSDCTHKLNKGEATKADIVMSLSDVMATKVSDFLKRARIKSGRVLLAGGVTKNKYIIRFLREKLPGHRVHRSRRGALPRGIRRRASWPRPRGASSRSGTTCSSRRRSSSPRYKSLKSAEGMVNYLAIEAAARRGRAANIFSASTAARPPPRLRSSTSRPTRSWRPITGGPTATRSTR